MKPTDKELADLNAEMHKLCGWNYDPSRHAWHRNGYWTVEPDTYTTNPAAAMEVLEKCIKELGTSDGGGQAAALAWLGDVQEEFQVTETDTCALEAVSPSLPLAICLFAKQLFSK